MKTAMLLLLLAVLCSTSIGRTLHERKRRVAGIEYDTYLDKDPANDDDYYEYDEYDIEEDDLFSCFTGGEQVPHFLMCDGYKDCTDGSDEIPANCEELGISTPPTSTTSTTTTTTTTTTPTTTTTTATTTTTTASLPPVEPNVRKPEDYGDYEDACTEEEFQCQSDLSICLPQTQVCDGIHDCPDKEDEANCTDRFFEATDPPQSTVQASSEYSASGNLIVQKNRTVAEGKRGPATNITVQENFCSSIHAFQCRSRPGDCVPRTLLCDGFPDCKDGSDEERCECQQSGEYYCLNGNCVDASTRCDGANDCGDFSDEILGCILFPSNELKLEKLTNVHESGKENGESIPDPDPTQSVKYIGPKSTIMLSENEPVTTSSDQIALPSFTASEVSRNQDRSSTSFVTEDVDFPICSLHPCANDGDCYENKHSFICVCKPGFKGPTCLQRAPIICKRGDPACNRALSTTFSNFISTILLLVFSFLISCLLS
uniref:sortilin-related receptor-like isoform X2 n=1 Tax=Styela clava TaxID=7725 RepID=UPI00193AB1BA|nr:sortilin-related receptor-like isoform X2 [Styela clava]